MKILLIDYWFGQNERGNHIDFKMLLIDSTSSQTRIEKISQKPKTDFDSGFYIVTKPSINHAPINECYKRTMLQFCDQIL